jgi:tRNA-dihydrouridine synthase B
MDMIPYFKYDILDFNAACPQRKVTVKGRGAALLQEPKKLGELLRVCVAYSKVPVTVKLRLGWNDPADAVSLAKMCEDCGVAAIFLHGRTRSQLYHGKVNYEAVAKVKKALRVPLIASGDIFNGPLAKRMFDETGCDGVLLARGAMGNPWAIREIEAYLKDGTCLPRPDVKDVAAVMQKHLKMYVDFFGEEAGVNQFHKFFAWYTKGFNDVRILRDKGMRVKGHDNFKKLIVEFAHTASKKI